MKKKIVCLIVLIALLIPQTALATTTSEVSLSSEQLQASIIECQNNKKIIESIIEEVAFYSSCSLMLFDLNEDWKIEDEKEQQYKEQLEIVKQKEAQEKLEKKFNEHYNATYVWQYLKGCGYSDVMCAGILGNLMAETGGQTLNIKWNSRSSGYYGIAQWGPGYKSIWGGTLHQQCEFLIKTIAYEINTYGYAYQKGFNYSSFCNLDSPEQAALAFAKAYERCGSGSYKQRMKNARIAYNYYAN